MRKFTLFLLIFALLLCYTGCSKDEEKENDAVVDTYLEIAQKYLDNGQPDLAISILEDALEECGENEDLAELLEEALLQKASAIDQDSTAATEATAPATEAPTETTAPPTAATTPTEATAAPTETPAVVSGYPIQINMADLLSANLLGQTFYSAYASGSLDSWMFLYVHGSSDPATVYDSLWYDPQLGQMTYYGILHQQAINAGWGDIWLEQVNRNSGSAY